LTARKILLHTRILLHTPTLEFKVETRMQAQVETRMQMRMLTRMRMQAQVETRMQTRMQTRMLITQRKQENGREGGRQANGRHGGGGQPGQTAAEKPRHTPAQPRHLTAQSRHTPVTPPGLYQEMSQVRQWWVEVEMRGVD
jgi:hypothetical protein